MIAARQLAEKTIEVTTKVKPKHKKSSYSTREEPAGTVEALGITIVRKAQTSTTTLAAVFFSGLDS